MRKMRVFFVSILLVFVVFPFGNTAWAPSSIPAPVIRSPIVKPPIVKPPIVKPPTVRPPTVRPPTVRPPMPPRAVLPRAIRVPAVRPPVVKPPIGVPIPRASPNGGTAPVPHSGGDTIIDVRKTGPRNSTDQLPANALEHGEFSLFDDAAVFTGDGKISAEHVMDRINKTEASQPLSKDGAVPTGMTEDEKSRAFTTDRKTGEVMLGDGVDGERPPTVSSTRAGVYKDGGSEEGNVSTDGESIEKTSNKRQEDVGDITNKAKLLADNLEKQAVLKETIAALRDHLKTMPDGPDKDALLAQLKALETKLNTMSEMSQMNMLELQEAMNNQQQLMQTLSNIMKNQNDTLKATINNMR